MKSGKDGVHLKTKKKKKKETLRQALKRAKKEGLSEIFFEGKRYKVAKNKPKATRLSLASKALPKR